MTILACGGELRGLVVRIIGLIVIGEVTSYTGIGCVVVIAIMASRALIGDGRMRP